MTKKVTTISIDEDLLRYAKKEIPNFSVFVENCIKAYLQEYNIFDIEQELEKIRQASLQIHILTSKKDETEFMVGRNKEAENKAWMNIWGLFRRNEIYDSKEVENAGLTLHLDAGSLIAMMEYLKLYAPAEELRKCDDWDYALILYEKMLHQDDMTVDF